LTHIATEVDLTELKAIALEAAANAVAITTRDGRIQWVNAAFTRLTGYTASEVVGKTPGILRSGKHSAAFYREMWETILSGRPWHGQLINRRKDGSLYVEEQTITPVQTDGQVSHFIAIKSDITQRKRQEEQLEYLATHDALTDLPNRRVLQRALKQAVARAGQGVPSAVVLLDMDNLKMINDSLGHSAGDKALIALAKRLQHHLRPQDLLARVAGDEFVVLLEDVNWDQAVDIAQRLRQAVVNAPVAIDGRDVFLTVSLGVVPVAACSDVEQLLASADAAMYQAKLRGGNRVQIAHVGAEAAGPVSHGFAATQKVHQALNQDRLLLHYQPIVRLADRQVCAFESLLRLRQEDGRVVSAGEFLALAEEAGFMNEIDRWVMEQTLRTLREHPDVALTINVSGHAFNDEELMRWLLGELERLGDGAARLGLELTETAVIHDLDMAKRSIERLRRAKCHVLLDDFGAGFNSFAYLRHLTVDAVKIDGGLVRDLRVNHRHRAMVQAITVLADAFDLVVIAEGVEDAPTAALLEDFGIECGQGYFFGRSYPAPWRAAD